MNNGDVLSNYRKINKKCSLSKYNNRRYIWTIYTNANQDKETINEHNAGYTNNILYLASNNKCIYNTIKCNCMHIIKEKLRKYKS